MSSDRFGEVERLYHEATLLRPEERAAFLDQACGGDEALRHEVESLLSLPTEADEFLSRTALEEAARAGDRPAEPQSWPTIPGYIVRRVLGEGGMGVVYLAEQETPFRRLVALKLIKPGMDTRRVVARFETERQALALMDHPNIAAVFDAGSTSEGRPYFVMEYVDGVSITEYCDRRRLSTQDRLALFVQVCAAVQHAHQKGVIHRDLKPSNVLVTERDGHPLPKVIDFGTAKAVAGAWNATATQGGQGLVLGTLEYMSPEQAALSADIDTATDVYSLGVLLYELLVGRLPFDTDELRAAGYDEIRRVIRESDPPKPSVRVDQRSDKSGAAARARQTDAPGLTRQLRGDLDWITLKALEKDRKRRYATVAALATDIGRFLDDQPVEARPPSSTYRIRKFTRRHRLGVTAVASIIAVLSAGLTASLVLYWQADALRSKAEWQEQQANEQREQAVAQRREADRAAAEAREERARAVGAQAEAEIQRELATEQREEAIAQRRAADAAAAESNEQRAKALDAQSDAEVQRTKAVNALRESTYFGYVATLAAAAGDLRTGAVAEARAQLLTIPEAQRGWEWQHLFIQTDESILNFSSAAPRCPPRLPTLSTMALSLDADGESILLRRCVTLERWSVTPLVHTDWTAPPSAFWILAENPRGLILTMHPIDPPANYHPTNPLTSRLVLTDRFGSGADVSFGPFATSPTCADISPDGSRIAVGLAQDRAAITARAETFEVWNTATGRLVARLAADPPVLPDTRTPGSCRIRFSPDGRTVATSGAVVHVWDAATGARRATDSLQAGAYRQAIAFSRDGKSLAIGRASGLVDVLDLSQSSSSLVRLSIDDRVAEESIPDHDRIIQTRLRSKREVVAVAFSPDGQTVVSATSTTVGLWDLKLSKRIRVLSGHAADVMDVAVSADGRRIYSVDAAGVVRVWPPRSDPAVLRVPGSSGNSGPFAMNPDGTVVGTATWDAALTTIRLSDLQQQVVRAPTPGEFASIAITPDGLRMFATEEMNGSIRRWTIASKETAAVSVYPRDVKAVKVSPTGALLAVSHGRSVTVLDALTMERLKTVEFVSPTMDVLFRDEDSVIISTGNAQEPSPSLIHIWNWRTGSVSAPVEPKPAVGPANPVWRLVLSPDARRLALMSNMFGTPTTISIWDSDLKSEINRLPPGDYQGLSFSPDGRRIVTVGGEENAVRIWDSDRLSLLLTLVDTDSHYGGVAFTRAGQIVAGRTKGGLTIWDTQIRRR